MSDREEEEMATKDLRRRLEKLEAEALHLAIDPDARPADATDDEWAALAILHHVLEHPPGAEITDEVWAELERRLLSGRPS
jgi:hypothetical protein